MFLNARAKPVLCSLGAVIFTWAGCHAGGEEAASVLNDGGDAHSSTQAGDSNAATQQDLPAGGNASVPGGTDASSPAPTLPGATLRPVASVYDSSLPPWPVSYSQADIDAQRQNGADLLTSIGHAIANQQPTYTVQPGVYRLANNSIEIFDTHNFSVLAAGAEIITEGQRAHFRLLGNTDFSLKGPVILDGDAFGFTQGTIVGTDGQTYIDIDLMAGYPAPNPQGRMMFFAPDGTSLRHFEDTAANMTNTSANRWRISVNPGTFGLYPALTQNVIAAGNLVLIDDAAGSNGGLEMRDNTNVTMTDVSVHTSCLTWGLPALGNDVFQRFHGTRRPGTNRLGAGGWMQIGYRGGSFTLLDSELAYNLDDLLNIGGIMGYVWQQAAPNAVYGALDELQVGQKVQFTDYDTLAPAGTATVTDKQTVSDTGLTDGFHAALQSRNLLNNGALVRLTLDRNISLGFSIIDLPDLRPHTMTVTNSWLHDGLAAGISLKGADQTTVTNSLVERVGYRGIGANIDPYWWEGGIPHSVEISHNTVTHTPYWLRPGGAAIDVGPQQTAAAATGTPIGSVDIAANSVQSPQAEAIHVGNATGVTITGNAIQNPVAQRNDLDNGNAVPYPRAAAISLDAVGPGTLVSGNAATEVDADVVPEFIWVSPRSDPSHLSAVNNSLSP